MSNTDSGPAVPVTPLTDPSGEPVDFGTALTLSLAGGQLLDVRRQEDGDLLRLIGADGQTAVTLLVTPAGPVLRFEGSLRIQATGDLELGAARIALHAQEMLSLSSGGGAQLAVAGDLDLSARVQNITAELGNVNVTANDDVRITGERVRVNC
jgi:ABC-type cobalamin transport system ATPase subunit